MNIQQALSFSFLKKTKLITQKEYEHQLFNDGANKNEAIDFIGFKSMDQLVNIE